MRSLRNLLNASQNFGAGVLLGMSAVTSVFAATGEQPFSLQGTVLAASLALLGVGLALKARSMRQKRNAPVHDTHHLRWWKNP